jgi:hypothetical protein
MPLQKRWPLVSTSVSGIAPEVWQRFKEEAAGRGLTFRDAIEQAIRDFARRVEADRNEEINNSRLDYYFRLQPSYSTGLFRLHSTGARSHPVQMHHEVLNLVRKIIVETGHKQNAVVLNAMMWWTNTEHHTSPRK